MYLVALWTATRTKSCFISTVAWQGVVLEERRCLANSELSTERGASAMRAWRAILVAHTRVGTV